MHSLRTPLLFCSGVEVGGGVLKVVALCYATVVARSSRESPSWELPRMCLGKWDSSKGVQYMQ